MCVREKESERERTKKEHNGHLKNFRERENNGERAAVLPPLRLDDYDEPANDYIYLN